MPVVQLSYFSATQRRHLTSANGTLIVLVVGDRFNGPQIKFSRSDRPGKQATNPNSDRMTEEDAENTQRDEARKRYLQGVVVAVVEALSDDVVTELRKTSVTKIQTVQMIEGVLKTVSDAALLQVDQSREEEIRMGEVVSKGADVAPEGVGHSESRECGKQENEGECHRRDKENGLEDTERASQRDKNRIVTEVRELSSSMGEDIAKCR